MQFAFIAQGIIAGLTMALGTYVLFKNVRSPINWAFFGVALGIAAWSVGLLFVLATESFFWIVVTLWSGALIVVGFVFLAEVFPEGTLPARNSFLFLLPLVVPFALAPSGLFISAVRFNQAGYLEPRNGVLFPLYALLLGGYLAWSFSKFFSRYRTLHGIRRVQMRYLIVGAGSFVSFGFLFDILLPAFRVFSFNLLGPLFSLAFISLIAYAIIRHEFMDIRFALRRGISYALLLGTLAVTFFGIEFLIEKFYTNDEVVDIIAATVGAILFSQFRSFFEALTDRIFFRKEYRYEEAVRELGEVTNATIDLPTLLEECNRFLMKTIKPAKVLFFFGEQSPPICFGGEMAEMTDAFVRSDLTCCSERAVFVQDLEREHSEEEDSFMRAAQQLGIAAGVPLVSHGTVTATMFLGEKLSDDIFRPKDRELLAVFSHQAGMAIENARLYTEAKEHAETLEKKVIERTSRITEMQESQSKFLADISHELQTPVAILRGNMEVLARGKSGEWKQAMRSMEATLDRMSRLIESLLSVARLNFSKEKLHKQEIKVQNLLEDIYGDCFMLTENAGVLLSFASDPVSVGGDRDKLKEVILNLVSNALKHTPREGAIGIFSVKRQKEVEITVQDSGKGIASENIPHLFERFYRINDGTGTVRGNGLGLNICRQIIETHGGTIRVESELGKGSRFIVSLPLFTGT